MNELSFTSTEYRRAMGEFATGVAVVTAGSCTHVHAMTANAITSVSLDPPLLLFCIDKRSVMAKKLVEHQQFTVNILSEGQAALSDHFAGRTAAVPPSFRFVDWLDGTRLECAPAALNCCLFALHEGGDHWIAVGRVRALHHADPATEPLIFHRGRYL